MDLLKANRKREKLEGLGFKGVNLNELKHMLFNEDTQELAIVNREGITRIYKFCMVD